jgi:hypothetical protein
VKRIAMIDPDMYARQCARPNQRIEANHWQPGQPEAIAAIHYGPEGKLIWIFYHAPSVQGQHIFNGAGALQPDGTIWRLGADDATVFHLTPIWILVDWRCPRASTRYTSILTRGIGS